MTIDLTFRDASISYGPVTPVSGLDLTVPAGSLVTLLGPSGCGKTTTLRTVAGLERLSAGELTMGARTVDAPGARQFVAPEKRDIGMVFQSYALWPHMTVRQNVEYPLKVNRSTRVARRERVEHLLAMMDLTRFADRLPARLSGGQQQRVAIARALARDPQVLLFDEPLSNLDARLRRSLRQEIRQVHLDNGATSLFVTHDHEEALAISDHVAVMLEGRVVQFGDPVATYRRPASRKVAEFFGFDTIVDVEVAGGRAHVLGTDAVLPLAGSELPGHEQSTLAVRRDQVHLLAVDDPNPARFDGTVTLSSYVGGVTEYEVDVAGLRLQCSVDDWTLGRIGRSIPVPGESVALALPHDGVAVFDREQAA